MISRMSCENPRRCGSRRCSHGSGMMEQVLVPVGLLPGTVHIRLGCLHVTLRRLDSLPDRLKRGATAYPFDRNIPTFTSPADTAWTQAPLGCALGRPGDDTGPRPRQRLPHAPAGPADARQEREHQRVRVLDAPGRCRARDPRHPRQGRRLRVDPVLRARRWLGVRELRGDGRHLRHGVRRGQAPGRCAEASRDQQLVLDLG